MFEQKGVVTIIGPRKTNSWKLPWKAVLRMSELREDAESAEVFTDVENLETSARRSSTRRLR